MEVSTSHGFRFFQRAVVEAVADGVDEEPLTLGFRGCEAHFQEAALKSVHPVQIVHNLFKNTFDLR